MPLPGVRPGLQVSQNAPNLLAVDWPPPPPLGYQSSHPLKSAPLPRRIRRLVARVPDFRSRRHPCHVRLVGFGVNRRALIGKLGIEPDPVGRPGASETPRRLEADN